MDSRPADDTDQLWPWDQGQLQGLWIPVVSFFFKKLGPVATLRKHESNRVTFKSVVSGSGWYKGKGCRGVCECPLLCLADYHYRMLWVTSNSQYLVGIGELFFLQVQKAACLPSKPEELENWQPSDSYPQPVMDRSWCINTAAPSLLRKIALRHVFCSFLECSCGISLTA